MRQIRESGRTDIIDIGSSVAVHSADQLKLQQIIESAHQESLAFGHYTEYPSSWGSLTLRRSAANLFHRWAGIDLDPATEVMVTGGIIKAVDAAIQALDITHVIVPDLAPYFVRSLATLRGKQLIEAPLDLTTGNLNLAVLHTRLKAAGVEPGKALFYITLPSAPAGTLPQDDFIEHELLPFAQTLHLPIISDSYVFATTFSGRPVRPLLSYPAAKTSLLIEATGVAKELHLPGIRVGAVAGNSEIINAMRLLASAALDMIPNPNQHLAAKAFDSIKPEAVGQRLNHELYQNILPRFTALHWPVIVPQAGLDMLVRIPSAFARADVIDHSLLTCLSLVNDSGVAFSPASVFGTQGDNYLRLVLKQQDGKIAQALDHLIHAGFDWRTAIPNSNLTISLNQLVSNLDLSRL